VYLPYPNNNKRTAQQLQAINTGPREMSTYMSSLYHCKNEGVNFTPKLERKCSHRLHSKCGSDWHSFKTHFL